MFDLNDAHLFVQAVEHGGFAPAARALRLSKSHLSTRIARLERQLEARLLNRTSRSFGLTLVGEDFYRHARAMLIEAESAALAVRQRLAEPAGTVRLTSSSATLHAGLVGVLAELALRYPKLRVQHQVSNDAIDLVGSGIDLAVRAHVRPLPDSSMIQRALGYSERWLVAAPGYIRQRGAPDEPADLACLDLVGMPGSDDRNAWTLRSEGGDERQVEVELRFGVDDLSAVLALAVGEVGVAAVPAGMCVAPLADGRLLRVLPGWRAGGAHITLLAPHRRGQLPSVRAAADLIAARLPHAMRLRHPGS